MFFRICISSQLPEHIISPKDSQALVCLLTAREFVNILDGRSSVGALLGWKGPDPEVQDAASTADLAEGARGTEQNPGTPWAGSTPQTPGTLSEGALLLHPAPHSPRCSPGSFGLTARWQSATTATVKAPSEMQPGLGLLAGASPSPTCSQLLIFPREHFHPLQNLTDLRSSSPHESPHTLHCGKANLLQ